MTTLASINHPTPLVSPTSLPRISFVSYVFIELLSGYSFFPFCGIRSPINIVLTSSSQNAVNTPLSQNFDVCFLSGLKLLVPREPWFKRVAIWRKRFLGWNFWFEKFWLSAISHCFDKGCSVFVRIRI